MHQHAMCALPKMGRDALSTASCLAHVWYACPRGTVTPHLTPLLEIYKTYTDFERTARQSA